MLLLSCSSQTTTVPVISYKKDQSIEEFKERIQKNYANGDFTEITHIDSIPKDFFQFVEKWKIAQNDERDYIDFKMADYGKPYDCCCMTSSLGPKRRLIFALNNGSEWIVCYNHGQGVVSNSKIIYVDLSDNKSLTWLYVTDFSDYAESNVSDDWNFKHNKIKSVIAKISKEEFNCYRNNDSLVGYRSSF
jgi:hypothetical protein